ncbi:MAG: type II 3-dehydroquinate dehydratase [Vicingaceae bacterium]
MKKIYIINGPNLNLLGQREPDIYGSQSMEEYLNELKQQFPKFSIDYFQSNVEGEIINKLQEVGFTYDGILLNAGGYTHTSVAIADAVVSIETDVIEIHISQPLAREKERQVNLLSKSCKGSISGFGMKSYHLGLEFFNS